MFICRVNNIEEGEPNSTVRMSFVAKSGVKLSAKRGIEITPVENDYIEWVTPVPVSMVDENIYYFSDFHLLTLVFMSSLDRGMIILEAEYG
jgi:hypothetical protein